VNSLKRKYVKALPAMQESLDIFNELDQSIDAEIRKEWEEQERLAMKFRGEHMDVYNVNKKKGKFLTHTTHNITYIALQFLEITPFLLLLDSIPAVTVMTQPLCGYKLGLDLRLNSMCVVGYTFFFTDNLQVANLSPGSQTKKKSESTISQAIVSEKTTVADKN
jgi:hypothetical protein